MKLIKDFQEGETLFGQLLVANLTKGETDKGKQYLNITFQDKSGTIEAKKWEINEEDSEIIQIGRVVLVEAYVVNYKDKLQLKVLSVSSIKNKDLDYNNFLKEPPIPQEELIKKLDYYLHSFKDRDVDLIINAVVKHFYKDYISYPGGIRIHHDFASGVLYHSLSMADLAEQIAKLYPNVDRDILVGGCLIHDIGKVYEYTSPVLPQMSLEGKLVGHISLMYGEFKKIVEDLNITSEVPLLLEHMILSHHGTREFGCPVLPSTKEAILLSMIDLLDSRMSIIDKAYDTIKPGEFSQKIWPLDNISLYRPKDR